MYDVAIPIMRGVRARRPRSEVGIDAGVTDDTTLARAIARGDHAAMRELHDRFGRRVFGVLLRALPDRGAAEDVFQQVMVEVWQRAESFDPARGSLAAWIMTLARSRAIDELRRRRPEPVDPHAVEIADRADDGFATAVAEWEMSELLAALPDDERSVLEMRFRLELSQSEIAERTGLPLGTVKTRMTRGLARLREGIDTGLVERSER